MRIRSKANILLILMISSVVAFVGMFLFNNWYNIQLERNLSSMAKMMSDWNLFDSETKNILGQKGDPALRLRNWNTSLQDLKASVVEFRSGYIINELRKRQSLNLKRWEDLTDSFLTESEKVQVLYSDFVTNFGTESGATRSIEYQIGAAESLRNFTPLFSAQQQLSRSFIRVIQTNEAFNQYLKQLLRDFDEVVTGIRQAFTWGIGGGIVLVFGPIAIYLLFFLSRLVKRIQILQSALERSSEGDFSSTVMVRAKDEMGQLADYVNILSVSMSQLLNRVRQSADVVKGTNSGLSNSLEIFTGNLKKVINSIDEMKIEISDLDTEINSTGQRLDTIGDGIGRLSERIDQQAVAMAESSSAVEEMEASIRRVAEISEERRSQAANLDALTEEGGTKVIETNKVVSEIISDIDAMNDIIKVIQSVAGRTNLLSMNAAIESAHAGDAGRGFAVVAEEIRKLAETTTQQSKQIQGTLKTIVQKISEASSSSSDSLRAFEIIQTEVRKFNSSMGEITNTMNELSGGAQEVLTSTTQINSITQETKEDAGSMNGELSAALEAMKRVNTYSKDVSRAIGQISGAAEQLSTEVDTVESLSKSTDEQVIVLEKQVSSFITQETPDDGDLGSEDYDRMLTSTRIEEVEVQDLEKDLNPEDGSEQWNPEKKSQEDKIPLETEEVTDVFLSDTPLVRAGNQAQNNIDTSKVDEAGVKLYKKDSDAR
jgi:methyl-accepting chemotaxis protein